MADIDVERKGASIWPWILGLIALALLIWLIAELLEDDDEVVVDTAEPVLVEPAPAPVVPPAAPVAAVGVPPAVEAYLNTCTGDAGTMTLDHQYTSNCIERLATAIDALLQAPSVAGMDVSAQLADYRQKADRLVQSAAMSDQHANLTREAFVSVGNLLNAVQDQRFPALDAQVGQLQQSARSVAPGTALLDQKDTVQRFFQQAGSLLSTMAASPAT